MIHYRPSWSLRQEQIQSQAANIHYSLFKSGWEWEKLMTLDAMKVYGFVCLKKWKNLVTLQLMPFE